MLEILQSTVEPVFVAAYVRDQEALAVYRESKAAARHEKEPIQWESLASSGLIRFASLSTEAETRAFVNFVAQRMDDGEAITLAIAIYQNLAVATDDKRARRLCQQQFPHVPLISTPELVKHWADNARPQADFLRQTLSNIERRANYSIAPHDPLYQWWQSHKA